MNYAFCPTVENVSYICTSNAHKINLPYTQAQTMNFKRGIRYDIFNS